MYEYQCPDVFFEGPIFIKKVAESRGIRVGVGGDWEIWVQFQYA